MLDFINHLLNGAKMKNNIKIYARSLLNPSMSDSVFYIITMFIFSFSVISGETLMFHLLSVVTNYINATFIITIAMFGMAAGSIAAYYLLRWNENLVLILSSIVLLLSIPLGYYNIINLSFFKYPYFLFLLFFSSTILISTLFSKGNSNTIYFVNLLGSAAGVFYPLIFIPMIKSENALFLLALIPALALFFNSFRFKHWLPSWTIRVLSIVLIIFILIFVNTNLFVPMAISKTDFETVIVPETEKLADIYNHDNDLKFLQRVFVKVEEKDIYRFTGDWVDRNRLKYLLSDIGYIKTYDLLYDVKSSSDFKIIQKVFSDRFSIAYSEDSSVGRVDILDTGKTLLLSINGYILDTMEHGFGAYFDPRVPHLDNAKIFIVGLSADGIVKSAKKLKNAKVSGIEINPVVMKIMKDDSQIAQFANFPYKDATVYYGEGRSFLQSDKNQYDMITLMNIHAEYGPVCTYAPENFHTIEGVQLLLNKLTDRGFIVYEEIIGSPRAQYAYYKMINTIKAALKKNNVEDPSQHIVTYQWDFWKGGVFRTVIVKKTPFEKNDLKDFYNYFNVIAASKSYDSVKLEYTPDKKTKTIVEKIILDEQLPDLVNLPDSIPYKDYVYNLLLKAKSDDDFKLFIKSYYRALQSDYFFLAKIPDSQREELKIAMKKAGYISDLNLEAATDDKPFPFDVYKKKTEITDIVKIMLILNGILLLIIIILLLNKVKHYSFSILPQSLFFIVTGFSYMLVEIILIQKFQLFIGSPLHSMIITLGCFLFFSGLGSFFTKKFKSIPLTISVFLIPVLLGFIYLYLDKIFIIAGKFSFNAKLWISVAIIAPITFLLGIPFPHALEVVKKKTTDEFGTLMYGISGVASSIGAALALYFNVAYGFSFTFMLGIFGYFLGFILFFLLFFKALKSA